MLSNIEAQMTALVCTAVPYASRIPSGTTDAEARSLADYLRRQSSSEDEAYGIAVQCWRDGNGLVAYHLMSNLFVSTSREDVREQTCFHLVRLSRNMGRLSETIGWAEYGVAHCPPRSDTHQISMHSMAFACEETGRIEDALVLYETAHKMYPGIPSLIDLARCMAKQGQRTDALKLIDAAVDMCKDDNMDRRVLLRTQRELQRDNAARPP